METIEAIFEHGVFRPTEPVALPENSRVTLQLFVENGEAGTAKGADGMEGIYEILDRRYDTGIHDLAARHNEPQP
jgi:predicted DNA-binding antitoxin AbrB/MazE fold protein